MNDKNQINKEVEKLIKEYKPIMGMITPEENLIFIKSLLKSAYLIGHVQALTERFNIK